MKKDSTPYNKNLEAVFCRLDFVSDDIFCFSTVESDHFE